MPIVEESLFRCDIGLKSRHRDAGTDVCLRCPLPPDYCVAGVINPATIRQKWADMEPACLVAFTAWLGVPLAVGEQIARRTLDPDKARSMDDYRTAVRGWRGNGV